MSTTLRIGALQVRAHDRDAFPDAFERIVTSMRSAAQALDLLVLPEATLPAYLLGDDRIDDDAVERGLATCATVARETSCAIVVGAAIRRNGRLFNSAVVIDRDGTIAGAADKLFLWHFDRKWFSAGERLAPIATSLGNIGALVCADGRIPAIAGGLVDAGADLLVMPTAWVTTGRNPAARENLQADLLARVRAWENGVPFVAANKCGVEQHMVAYCGKSQIVGRDGTLLALASESDPQCITATIETARATPRRVATGSATPRGRADSRPVRVVFSPLPLPADIDARVHVLDADLAISPADLATVGRLDEHLPTACVDLAQLADPNFLVAYRRSGYRCVVVTGDASPPWLENVARARAAELRMFLIVFAGAQRAFAVDPDGTIVAGSFDDFSLPTVTIDPARAEITGVAPGTDIADGIERVGALIQPGVAS